MYDRDDSAWFRGSELSRLMTLLVIAVVGWVAVWLYLRSPEPPPERVAVVVGRPEAIRPDKSTEFETVKDLTPVGFRDSAAYEKLLGQSRESSPRDLAARARDDIQFGQVITKADHYRGVPLHILGSAQRVLRYESPMSKNGWLYEAWVITPGSQGHPWVCVFEDAPKGFPIGPETSERIVFNGYFLKLMSYQAADKRRFAPLLIGRIGWTAPSATAGRWKMPSIYWFGLVLVIMMVISLARWMLQLRRMFSTRPTSYLMARSRPTEEISGEDLQDWLENTADDSDATSQS